MTFGDPIAVGPNGVLVRNAVQSRNYVPSTSGWAIMSDGTAEFNDIIINGGGGLGRIVIDGDTFTVYNNFGQRVVVINSDGIAIGPNLADGTQSILTLDPNNPEITFKPADSGGTSYGIAGILTTNAGNPSLNAYLELFSPSRNGFFDPQTFLKLTSGIAGGSVLSSMDITTQEITLGGNRVFLLAQLDNADSNANLTLTTSSVLIPGCSLTYNSVPAGAKWDATLSMDNIIGATAGVTNVGELWVQLNGGTLTKQTGDNNNAQGVGNRVTGERSWSGTFAAGGTLHFEAHAKFVGGGGTNQVLSPHTTLQVKVYY